MRVVKTSLTKTGDTRIEIGPPPCLTSGPADDKEFWSVAPLPRRQQKNGKNRASIDLRASRTVTLIAFSLPSAWPTRSRSIRCNRIVGASGLPLPRFVSLKSGRVNARIGPGINYAVSWLYSRPGLPMEIIQEYDNWRKVRDLDGAEGWINQSLLTGKRTAIAAPWQRGKEAEIRLLEEPERMPARSPCSSRASSARSTSATATGAR